MFVSIRLPDGQIRRRTVTFGLDALRRSDRRIACADSFSIEKMDTGYEIQIEIEGVTGTVRVNPQVAPFAASPFGALPTWLLRLFGQQRPPIAYTSFVPRGSAQVHLNVDELCIQQTGIAYHEQGRFQGTTHEFQFEGWFWFHVLGSEWTIFGAENTFLYMTDGNRIIPHTYPLRKETFVVSKKVYSPVDPRVITAATLQFSTDEISLSVEFDQLDEGNLTYWPSTDPSQLWCIRQAIARVQIRQGKSHHSFSAPSLLETCSCWPQVGRLPSENTPVADLAK